MTRIASPHDKFFKEVFSDIENVADFINGIFPEEIKANLNLNSLAIDNNSYIDEKLEEQFSDIVYTCEYKGTGQIRVTLLFEHKSYQVKYPHFQILKYMVNIWETCIKQNTELTPVIPVVVYHGEGRWDSRDLSEYFSGIDKNLVRYIPGFNYILADLSRYTDDEIKDSLFQKVSLETAFLIMKNIHNEDSLRKNLADFLNICSLYFKEEKGLNFLKALILYLYSAGDLETTEVIQAVSALSEAGGTEAMSTATRLMEMGKIKGFEEGIEKGIKKGIEQGIEKGIEKGKLIENQDILVKFMKNRFGSAITNADIKSIKACTDLPRLKDALEVLLSADNKDAVLSKIR